MEKKKSWKMNNADRVISDKEFSCDVAEYSDLSKMVNKEYLMVGDKFVGVGYVTEAELEPDERVKELELELDERVKAR